MVAHERHDDGVAGEGFGVRPNPGQDGPAGVADEDTLGARELAGSTLTVKVRFSDFETLTRAHGQGDRPLDRDSVRRTLPYLLDRALATRTRHRVRLLGVTVSALGPLDAARPVQLELGGLGR